MARLSISVLAVACASATEIPSSYGASCTEGFSNDGFGTQDLEEPEHLHLLQAGHWHQREAKGSVALPANISRNVPAVLATSFDAAAVAALSSGRSSRQRSSSPPPELFVAVFTARKTPMENRSTLRALWQEVDAGSGNICARFIVCRNMSDSYEPALQAEAASHGDMLFLPCDEGYAKGLLTKKVIASMKAYGEASKTEHLDTCLNRPLFMKVDDDAFVDGHRFREGLAAAARLYGESMYAGVQVVNPDNLVVIKDPSNQWFEPEDVWPHDTYPSCMYGGPGYILGRSLIQRILDEGIAERHILWNEDRAVGVWVDALRNLSISVNFVQIAGCNGFSNDYPVMSGPWGLYPYVLHHHLSHACIQCLVNLTRTNNPDVETDACFKLDRRNDDLTR
jgi:hypothetical protein